MNLNLKRQKYALLATAVIGSCCPVLSSAHSSIHDVSSAVLQNQTIRGLVVDKKTGEPVIGANVVVKGTTNGTITDLDGNFTLDAPLGAVIEISYIGFKSIEMKATANMKVSLLEDSETLDEVIVVGYGIQKKESLTGAMSTVKEGQGCHHS